MKIAGMSGKRQLLRYFGLATVLLVLLIIECAGVLGEFLCPFHAERDSRGLRATGYGRYEA